MIFAYNKEGFKEISNSDIQNIELLNRELTADNKLAIIESDSFPPFGKKLVDGKLVDKSEKERVVSGEISISDVRNKVLDLINSECEKQIISGFESSALGDTYIYDSDTVDQLNLIGSVATGGTVLYKCTRKSDGKRDFYSHTNSQMKKVLNDAANRKIALLQKCYQLKQSVLALTDYDSIVGFKIDMEIA